MSAPLPPRDADGYLLNPEDWSHAVAAALAAQDGTQLSAEHVMILDALRDFHDTFDHAPNNRAMVNYLGKTLGSEWGNSARIMRLFGGTAARTAARWAGLPKPAHCL